jgi:hypothetical protein
MSAQSSILGAAIASVKAFLPRKLVRTSLSLKPCCNPNSCSDVFCTTCFHTLTSELVQAFCAHHCTFKLCGEGGFK